LGLYTEVSDTCSGLSCIRGSEDQRWVHKASDLRMHTVDGALGRIDIHAGLDHRTLDSTASTNSPDGLGSVMQATHVRVQSTSMEG
jgi:hypothetical protein